MTFQRGTLYLLSFLSLLLPACTDSTAPPPNKAQDGGTAFDGSFEPDANSFVLKRVDVAPPGYEPIYDDLVGSNLLVDPTQETVSIDVAVRNAGPLTLYAPATIWLNRFVPQEVMPLNADFALDPIGESFPPGKYGYDYAGLLGENGALRPGESSEAKSWVFRDPGLGSFAFAATAAFALVPDRPLIAGVMFSDDDRNGVRDANEGPYHAGGVRVEFPSGTAVYASPDEAGVYRVSVDETGLHRVSFVSILACVACECVTTPNPLEVFLVPGPDGRPQSFEDAHFGIYPGPCFDPPPDSTVVLTERDPEAIEQDFYQLLSAELVGETLQLRVGFSGCGPDHPFTLYAGRPLTEPYPARTWMLLSHDDRGELCAAYWETSLSFDLHPIELEHVRQYGAPGDVRLRFEDFVGIGRDFLLQPELEFVTGSVLQIDDATPVDGGVSIQLATDNNEVVNLLFSTLFTVTPPPQWRWDLYELIASLEVGEYVRAGGVRVDGRISLRELTRFVR
jgi:hypothetical protein